MPSDLPAGRQRLPRGGHGTDFTAKDFRTWSATLPATTLLEREAPPRGTAAARRTINRCIGTVAAALGNTPAVCRKSHVHPGVFSAFVDGRLKGARPCRIAAKIAVQPADIVRARQSLLRLAAAAP
ncbi:MAG: hypothetical protein L6R19_00275 [Alphaproteobacteria bacterium]|nr:hypothetical protein [Alphaproteobacteria bacterium]